MLEDNSTDHQRLTDQRTKINVCWALLIAAALSLHIGCDAWGVHRRVNVLGQVTLEGEVLEDAIVVFVPRLFRDGQGAVQPIAFGKTDASGSFQLQSGDQQGVLPGRYRVLIFKQDALSPAAVKVESDPLIESINVELATLFREPKVNQLQTLGVPTTYNLESELEYEVAMTAAVAKPEFALSQNSR